MTSPRAGRSPLAFISYRRQDSWAGAGWLAQPLQGVFGPHSVFIDVDSIRVGDDWPRRIDAALRDATALLVVMGPHWLRIGDLYGKRRLDQEDDWVRKEILHAFEHKLLIIPL